MYGISNLASATARHLNEQDRKAARESFISTRSDEIRGEYTWRDLDAAMGDAPEAEREKFWSALLEWLEVDHKYLHNRRVDHIAAPLQAAAAQAIAAQVNRELNKEHDA